MKKRNGFSTSEIIILIVILGFAFIGVTVKLSYAFKDNKEELYNLEIDNIIERAETYGQSNLELFNKDGKVTITVKDLIRAGYLLPNKEDDYKDPRDKNKNLNDLKINLNYNDEKVSAFLVK